MPSAAGGKAKLGGARYRVLSMRQQSLSRSVYDHQNMRTRSIPTRQTRSLLAFQQQLQQQRSRQQAWRMLNTLLHHQQQLLSLLHHQQQLQSQQQ